MIIFNYLLFICKKKKRREEHKNWILCAHSQYIKYYEKKHKERNKWTLFITIYFQCMFLKILKKNRKKNIKHNFINSKWIIWQIMMINKNQIKKLNISIYIIILFLIFSIGSRLFHKLVWNNVCIINNVIG